MDEMMMTEVRVKGEAQHQILPREELGRLLDKGLVDGVFKYGLSARTEPGEAETKATYNTGHSGLRGDRPTASAVITASTVDRDGDIVRADGLDVANYLKNPIVLPMHTLSADVYPVAMTERMKQTKNSWWAKFQWLVDLDATAQRAAEYMQLWDAGVLNCTSIGFIPTKWEPMKDGMGYDFKGAELLEFSTVFIPSNRDALRTEGMKQFLQVAGELITAGPSPLMKGWLVGQEAEGRPKQVAGGTSFGGSACNSGPVVVTITDEGGTVSATTALGGNVTYTVEPAGAVLYDSDPKAAPLPEEVECATFDEVKLACAAGALSTERAFEIVERLMSEQKSGADAARAEAESWKSQCAALSARVVDKFRG